FHFRGPPDSLDLVAHNLETFTMLAKGVDEPTWTHHLRNGDIAQWLREQIKDDELADEIAALACREDAAATRRAALEAIARRYTPVATPEVMMRADARRSDRASSRASQSERPSAPAQQHQ